MVKLIFMCHQQRSGVLQCFNFSDPKIKPEAPKFTVSLKDQNLESGEKLVLETEVKGEFVSMAIDRRYSPFVKNRHIIEDPW